MATTKYVRDSLLKAMTDPASVDEIMNQIRQMLEGNLSPPIPSYLVERVWEQLRGKWKTMGHPRARVCLTFFAHFWVEYHLRDRDFGESDFLYALKKLPLDVRARFEAKVDEVIDQWKTNNFVEPVSKAADATSL